MFDSRIPLRCLDDKESGSYLTGQLNECVSSVIYTVSRWWPWVSFVIIPLIFISRINQMPEIFVILIINSPNAYTRCVEERELEMNLALEVSFETGSCVPVGALLGKYLRSNTSLLVTKECIGSRSSNGKRRGRSLDLESFSCFLETSSTPLSCRVYSKPPTSHQSSLDLVSS